MLKSTKKN